MKGLPVENSYVRYGIIILLLCALVYGNSVQNNYSLDDHLVNSRNPLTQDGIKGFDKIFTSYSFKEKDFNYEYRPVMLCSFALEYAAFGTNPHISHIISILLFAVFSFLLFRFFRIIFPEYSELIIFFGVILFIVHPIHTEVVDNIKSRDELLSGLFGMAMLINLKQFLNKRNLWKLFFVFIFFGLGFFSKESFIVYIGIVPLLFLFDRFEKGKFTVNILFAFVSLIIAYLCIRFGRHALLSGETYNRTSTFFENPLYFSGFAARIPAGFSISLYYVKLLFWPFELSYYYGYNQIPVNTWSDFFPYFGILFYVAALFLAFKYYANNKLLSFSILLLLVNLFASSGILKVMPGILGERFIFLGSAGFCMAIVVLLYNLFEKCEWIWTVESRMRAKPFAILVFGFLIIVPAVKLFSRNKVWKSELDLVLTDVKHLENSAKANDMAAYQLMGKLRSNPNSPNGPELLIDAEKYALRSIEIYPDNIACVNNLATIYFIEKKYNESEKYYLKGLAIDSTDANVLFNLATIYDTENQIDKAYSCFCKALSYNPEIPNLIPVFKQFVVKNNKLVDAIASVSDILTIFPQNYNLHLLIIDFYNAQHDYNSSLKYLDQAYKIKPSDELAKFIETIKGVNNNKP